MIGKFKIRRRLRKKGMLKVRHGSLVVDLFEKVKSESKAKRQR